MTKMTTVFPRSQQVWADDVQVGQELPPLVKRPTSVQLFRFSAVTWNPHRIHFDRTYAATEGYEDVLVQGHLHGAFLMQAVQDWAGPLGRLLTFRWQNRHLAVPGDTLTVTGEVTAVHDDNAEVELREVNQEGRLCAPAWASVRLPRRSR